MKRKSRRVLANIDGRALDDWDVTTGRHLFAYRSGLPSWMTTQGTTGHTS